MWSNPLTAEGILAMNFWRARSDRAGTECQKCQKNRGLSHLICNYKIVERGKFTESDAPGSTASGKTDVSQGPETQIPLRDAIHNDSRLRTCNTIVIWLMASFVFSVVLVFLKRTSLEPGLIQINARLILGALGAATWPTTADSVVINCA